MAQHRVRAIKLIRVEDEDQPKFKGMGRRWHVPGNDSAVFTCGTARLESLSQLGAVIELDAVGTAVPSAAVPADDPPSDDLPLDFPYRSLLASAGVNTLTEVAEIPDLTELSGIGSSKAQAILDALAELE